MDKTKILKKPKKSLPHIQKLKKNKVNKKSENPDLVLRKNAKLKEYDPIKNLLDTKKMGAAIMECLIENDTEGVLEILESYLYAVNKTQFLKEAKISRSTAYNLLKRRNPTIKTLAKIMHASAHS